MVTLVSDLCVKNFRGIKDLEIKGLTRFNVFLGKNASGKTSVLEAFCLVCNRGNATAAGIVGSRRDLPRVTDESDLSLRSMFFNGDASNEPTFNYTFQGSSRTLVVRPVFKLQPFVARGRGMQTLWEPPLQEADSSGQIFGVSLLYTVNGKPSFKNYAQVSSPDPDLRSWGGLVDVRVDPVPGQTGSFFVQARQANSVKETASVLDKLIEQRREEQFFELLRSIDSDVQSLTASVRGGQPVIWVRKKDTQLLLNVMGDGFCRICLIATGLFSKRSKMLIIDEIDSGLHHTVMPTFWKHLIRLANQLDFQLVCATHNDEMLAAAAEAFADAPEQIAAFRLDRSADGTHKAVRYDKEVFRDAAEAGYEVRG
jgi:predicted ATPase